MTHSERAQLLRTRAKAKITPVPIIDSSPLGQFRTKHPQITPIRLKPLIRRADLKTPSYPNFCSWPKIEAKNKERVPVWVKVEEPKSPVTVRPDRREKGEKPLVKISRQVGKKLEKVKGWDWHRTR